MVVRVVQMDLQYNPNSVGDSQQFLRHSCIFHVVTSPVSYLYC